MIESSVNNDSIQSELRQRFGAFVQVFADLAANGSPVDLHVGVVTSDDGAGDIPGGSCDAAPGGQRGLLQVMPSPNAVVPPTGCQAPIGAPFIAYAFGPNGGPATTNLANGTDTQAMVQTFSCMASVGAKGCGFVAPLESAFAALLNTNENAGFLRADAVLAVVFVGLKDDGSAPPATKIYEPTLNSPEPMLGLLCDGMPIPTGTATSLACWPTLASNPNPGYDITRYIDFFTQPPSRGGLKLSPENVLLFAIDGPEAPFETIFAEDGSGLGEPPSPTYVSCDSLDPTSNPPCVERIQHSCQNQAAPLFFADPAARINAVVSTAAHHEILSACGDDLTTAPDYSTALTSIARQIAATLPASCPPTAD